MKPLDSWRDGSHVWIQDDLPNDFSGARLLTFGYNTAYTGDATFGRIGGVAEQLLKARRLERGEVGNEYNKHSSIDGYIVPGVTLTLCLPQPWWSGRQAGHGKS